MKKAIVIGGGLGGLTASIYLAHAGWDVTLLEKNKTLGGKLQQVNQKGFHFDLGPSTITMKHIFEQVFQDTGRDSRDYISFYPISPIARNFFPDGNVVELTADVEKMQQQMSAYSKADAKAYPAFLDESKRLFQISEKAFLHKPLFLWEEKRQIGLLRDFAKIRPLQSFQRLLKRYFRHPNTLQMFGRYATYVGSSPYQAPSIFAMLAYLEAGIGVYGIKGGTYKLVEAFEKLAVELGVRIKTRTDVTSIRTNKKRVIGVETTHGDYACDTLIGNGDALSLYSGLLDESQRPHFPDRKIQQLEPSLSGFTMLLGVERCYEQLAHHNVFFPSNYQAEFTSIFEEKRYVKKPTLYICHSGASDHDLAPAGMSNLFVLANAPFLTGINQLQDRKDYGEQLIQQLEGYGLTSLSDSIVYQETQTPADLAVRTRAYRGAIYGISSNDFQQAFFRIPNKDKYIKGLWFAGGSTHPGGGTPMVTLSGKLTAQAIIEG
ncbi:phytoene desaturase family protein [Terribacillus saccharophilus]|uniref:phytoene desaturase family protein n=1 Tax=Terribacillus saccharophilus TaxID=361277 RepID=UPI0039820A6E